MNRFVVAAGLAAGAGLAASLGAGAIERRAARWFLPDRRADPPGSDAGAGRTRAPGWIGWDRAPERAGRDRVPSRDPAPRSQAPPVKPASATSPPFTAPRDQAMLGGQVRPTDQRPATPRGQAVLVLGHADAGPRAGRINRRRIARGLAALEADGVLIVSEPVHAAKARALLAAQRPDLAARLVADPNPAPRLASPWRVGLGLIDLLLSRRVAGWAQDSARGLAGLRRLAALRR